MTTEGTAPAMIVVDDVVDTGSYLADGTVVVEVATRDGARHELRIAEAAVRRLADLLREQLRLLDAYRAEAGPPAGAEIDPAAPSVTSALVGDALDDA